MRESVLLINFQSEETEKAMKRICISQKIRVRTVGVEDYQQTIGYLAGLKEQEERAASECCEELEQELLVFAALPDQKLNEILQQMRKAKIQIPYKAILTPTNQNWTVTELYKEIASEHEAMRAQRES